MALQLAITLPNGTVANYHRIVDPVTVRPVEKTATATIASYVSQSIRQADATQFVVQGNYDVTPAFFADGVTTVTADPRQTVYDYLKTTPTFTGATDV